MTGISSNVLSVLTSASQHGGVGFGNVEESVEDMSKGRSWLGDDIESEPTRLW